MVSKSRYLAVVMTGLAIVHGGHVRADQQYLAPGQGQGMQARAILPGSPVSGSPGMSQRQGIPTGTNVTYPTGVKAERPRAASAGKSSAGIQDQVPVSTKGTPIGKSTSTRAQQIPAPARPRFIVKDFHSVQTAPTQPVYVAQPDLQARPLQSGTPRLIVKNTQPSQMLQPSWPTSAYPTQGGGVKNSQQAQLLGQ
ncbi:MAG: hypothetical protein U0797_27645 [Gemmataceae bacterium]